MRTITLLQPSRVVFGLDCWLECIPYIREKRLSRILIVYSGSQSEQARTLQAMFREQGIDASRMVTPSGEPTVEAFEDLLKDTRSTKPDGIVGLGGGSALDLAKLLAVFVRSAQMVQECFGIGKVHGKGCHLVCIPTTSGTGSEVSPNAILLDTVEQLKKGVISEYLVADAAFVDPRLTVGLPAEITAYTGLDALTHCIEAYTNKFAHPLIDEYALQGIRLIANHIEPAVHDGKNLVAREAMSLGSMLGGMCLGPVNTAAVHALAYPLGGEFHLPHGLSNAVLLAEVFAFNAEADPERHAAVALALECIPREDSLQLALDGAQRLRNLVSACGVDRTLAHHGISRDQVPHMARAALKVERLLKNNCRPMRLEDIEMIYLKCLDSH